MLRLFDWTENDPVGRQFRKSFKWDTKPAPDGVHEMAAQPPPRLTAWKFTYWLPHSLDAELLLSWLQSDKDMLRSKEPYFKGYAFTPLAMLWESDPHTARITFYSLLSALLAIMLVSSRDVSIERQCVSEVRSLFLHGVVIINYAAFFACMCVFAFACMDIDDILTYSKCTLCVACGYNGHFSGRLPPRLHDSLGFTPQSHYDGELATSNR